VGNFYTNIAVMADADRVVPVLEHVGRDAYVAPSGSVCVVLDRESDRQDTEILAALAEAISREADTHAFAVLNPTTMCCGSSCTSGEIWDRRKRAHPRRPAVRLTD
jgi:hypothetical protein